MMYLWLLKLSHSWWRGCLAFLHSSVRPRRALRADTIACHLADVQPCDRLFHFFLAREDMLAAPIISPFKWIHDWLTHNISWHLSHIVLARDDFDRESFNWDPQWHDASSDWILDHCKGSRLSLSGGLRVMHIGIFPGGADIILFHEYLLASMLWKVRKPLGNYSLVAHCTCLKIYFFLLFIINKASFEVLTEIYL